MSNDAINTKLYTHVQAIQTNHSSHSFQKVTALECNFCDNDPDYVYC